MAQTPQTTPPPPTGGRLRLGPAAKAIIIGLALVELALFLAFALPQWGGRAAAETSRASGERKPRHGPGSKAKASDEEAKDEDGGGGSARNQPPSDSDAADNKQSDSSEDGKVSKDPGKLEALKKKLTDEQVNICFLKGTEPPFSGKYYRLKDPGEYRCAVCAQALFESDTKFDSGTGWPSFWDTAFPGAVSEVEDNSHGMRRIEVTCSACGSHLGHVFPDGPEPTGLRYCINSLSLEFIPAEQLAREKAERQSASPDGGAGGAAAEQ